MPLRRPDREGILGLQERLVGGEQAMTDAQNDDLTDAQCLELTDDLHALQAELTRAQATSVEGAKPVDLGESIGRLSRMDAMQQQKMVQAGRESVSRRLALIDVALKSLADGEYGECKRCEEPVGYRRLKARPESPLCLECQSRTERRSR